MPITSFLLILTVTVLNIKLNAHWVNGLEMHFAELIKSS